MPNKPANSIEYYDRNAAAFFDRTVHADMAPLYRPFLDALPPGAHILDAGCGSGRDALAFMQRGYQVTAMDGSAQMAALAAEHIGQPVHVLTFDEILWRCTFDGIWACASLLHVPYAKLPIAMNRLTDALKPSGVLLCSFKQGNGERTVDGRRFTDMDESRMEHVVAATGGLQIMAMWRTQDQRRELSHLRWLNALLRKDR